MTQTGSRSWPSLASVYQVNSNVCIGQNVYPLKFNVMGMQLNPIWIDWVRLILNVNYFKFPASTTVLTVRMKPIAQLLSHAYRSQSQIWIAPTRIDCVLSIRNAFNRISYATGFMIVRLMVLTKDFVAKKNFVIQLPNVRIFVIIRPKDTFARVHHICF